MPPSSKLDLVGLAEVAELLGTSRRQAVRWTQHTGFPEPVARLRMGPIWRRADGTRWMKQRKPNGRRKRPAGRGTPTDLGGDLAANGLLEPNARSLVARRKRPGTLRVVNSPAPPRSTRATDRAPRS